MSLWALAWVALRLYCKRYVKSSIGLYLTLLLDKDGWQEAIETV